VVPKLSSLKNLHSVVAGYEDEDWWGGLIFGLAVTFESRVQAPHGFIIATHHLPPKKLLAATVTKQASILLLLPYIVLVQYFFIDVVKCRHLLKSSVAIKLGAL
jgi:hypothetical protein